MFPASRFTILALALAGASIPECFAQGASSSFSGRNGTPEFSDGVTVQKVVEPQVRRAEAVSTRRAVAVESVPYDPGSAAGAAFRAGDSFQLRLTGMPAEDALMYALDFTIGGDGYVNIPLGGQVRAAGLTQSQLEKAIERRLIEEKIFRWPTATINVPNQVRFVTVGGNVRAPNRLAWSPDLTLLAAISAQGGPGDFAGDKVVLIRNGVPTTFSMKRLKRSPADDPKLLPGDQLDLR